MVCCFAVVVDVGDSGAGSSPTPVGSSKSHLLLEDNLPTAPVPKINPRLIAVIPEVYSSFCGGSDVNADVERHSLFDFCLIIIGGNMQIVSSSKLRLTN